MHPEPYEHDSVPGGGPDADDTTALPAGGVSGDGEETGAVPGDGADGGAVPGDGEETGGGSGRPPGSFRRGRARFRGWRRSRPFWGGLLLILAGLELLLIPVGSLLVHGAVKIVIYIGIGGVFGVLFGALLIACGLLSWFHPVQRVFYAIVGVLLALASFVVTNLGGFFLGMLLGVVGASLVFGWAPVTPPDGPPRRHRKTPGRPPRDDGLDGVLGESRPGNGPGGSRLLALPVVPLLVAGLAMTGQAPALAARPAASSGCLIPLLSFLCPSPSSSPAAGAPASVVAKAPATGTATATPATTQSPTAAAAPDPSPIPDPSPTPAPDPSPTVTGSPSPSPSKSVNPNANKKAAAVPALTAAAVPASLTAGSALMTGLSYDGVATVPTANGSQQMLKFSMNSLSLSGGIVLTVTDGSHTQVTRNSAIDFSGHVVLYATKLSGKLLGIPLTFTPSNPPPLVLPIMAFTDVVTDQPLTTADSLQAPGLDITGS